jgi:hypothetical protein
MADMQEHISGYDAFNNVSSSTRPVSSLLPEVCATHRCMCVVTMCTCGSTLILSVPFQMLHELLRSGSLGLSYRRLQGESVVILGDSNIVVTVVHRSCVVCGGAAAVTMRHRTPTIIPSLQPYPLPGAAATTGGREC